MDIRIISAAFIIGIFVSDFFGVINMLLFAGSAAVILFIRAIFKKKIPLMLMLAVLSFVLGGAAYKSAALTEFDDTGKFLGRETVIEGYICDIPYKQYDMMKYTLNATEINNEKVNEKIIVSAKESYKFGDSVLLYGTLKPLKEQMNEGGYNAVTYYKAKGITARITAKASQTYADGKKHFSAAYLANSARNKVSQLIDTYYSGDRAATLKAVLAGNFHFLSEETSSLLTRTSVRSLFYPAYVHIMLINIFVGAFSSIVKKTFCFICAYKYRPPVVFERISVRGGGARLGADIQKGILSERVCGGNSRYCGIKPDACIQFGIRYVGFGSGTGQSALRSGGKAVKNTNIAEKNNHNADYMHDRAFAAVGVLFQQRFAVFGSRIADYSAGGCGNSCCFAVLSGAFGFYGKGVYRRAYYERTDKRINACPQNNRQTPVFEGVYKNSVRYGFDGVRICDCGFGI